MSILIGDKPAVTTGVLATVLRGQDPGEAWEQLNRMVIMDAQVRQSIREISKTEEGRELLDESRCAWRARGFNAPFDFLFDEEERS
jgi:hypothetical protein